VLGHEVAGMIEAVGSAFTGFQPGERIAISPSRPCGLCRYCQQGLQNHCLDMRYYGSAMRTPHVQGAFRNMLLCEATQCVKVAEHVPLRLAALAEPFSVGLHGVSRAGPLLGKRVLVHPGAVIGADGFGLAFERDHWIKVPQLGGVRVGDDCEIGANTTIDRGAIEDTVLEEDVRLDNQIQIAHNVTIGAHTAMAGCAAVAGSAKIGRYCLIGGGAGILGHLSIADRVTITARALVTHSIHAAGEYSSGVPIQESRQWRRNAARFKHLDELARRLQALEKKDMKS